MQDDVMNAEMNTLKFEQKSSLDAVQAKERELQKIQVRRGGGGGSGGYRREEKKRSFKPWLSPHTFSCLWSTIPGRGRLGGPHSCLRILLHVFGLQ